MLILFFLSSFFLGISYSQTPKLYLAAGGGLWQGPLVFEPYVAAYTRQQASASFSFGGQFDIFPSLSFVPEIGGECYQMNYTYVSARDPRSVDAKLGLFYARLSPGLEYRPFKGLSLRVALNGLISFGAIGSYSVYTFVSGEGNLLTGDYNNRFSRIRNVGNIGPELNIGYDFTLPRGAMLGPRVSGYVGPEPVFLPNFDTPMNPVIHRLSLEIVYTFSSGKKGTQ